MITVGSGRREGGRKGREGGEKGEGGREERRGREGGREELQKKWEDRINGGKEREERDTCMYMH